MNRLEQQSRQVTQRLPGKRIRPPAVKRDPVIAALIAKLPPDGGRFDRNLRVNWLRQVAMAFDGAYGVQHPIPIDAARELTITGREGAIVDIPNILTSKPTPIAAAAEPDEIRYFVDKEGFARKEPGNVRIRPFDVPPGETLEDEREGDDELDSIKWADGNWPPAAYPHPLTIAKA